MARLLHKQVEHLAERQVGWLDHYDGRAICDEGFPLFTDIHQFPIFRDDQPTTPCDNGNPVDIADRSDRCGLAEFPAQVTHLVEYTVDAKRFRNFIPHIFIEEDGH